jgi:hypothetical protein
LRLRDVFGRQDWNVRSRREASVFVRVAVDGVIEEVGADPTVVEQGVALAGCTVADDLLSLALEVDQELEQRPLRLDDIVGEAPIALRVEQALGSFAREQLRHGRRGCTPSLGVRAVSEKYE